MLIFDQLNKADRHLRALSWVVAAGVITLLSGLWWVQVVRSRSYVDDQRNQSYRTVRVPAPRGRILDRHGVVLAENHPSYNISLYLEDRALRETAQQLYRTAEASARQAARVTRQPTTLEKFLSRFGYQPNLTQSRGLTVAERAQLRRQARHTVASNTVWQLGVTLGQPLICNEAIFHKHYSNSLALPLPVLSSLNATQVARFQERSRPLPGMEMDVHPKRVYPQGKLAAHVIGYLRRGDESVEDELSFYNYRLPDFRGESGIERALDETLRGKAGGKSVLVNNVGYRQGETIWSAVEAGQDVTLTIDAEIQRTAEQALETANAQKPVRGAAVVLDCRTGEILALASAPAFDPNKFIPRITPEIWLEYDDADTTPMLNRAVYGGHPPGSIFKIVVALAALDAGLLNPRDGYRSEGFYRLGNRSIGDTAGVGDFDFRRAFIKSSNPYFIKYGLDTGRERIIALAQRMHFGERTGIPLGQDSAGVLPTTEWIRQNRGGWSQGDTANISIGQDPLKVTPLQVAVAVAAVANGGKVLWPQLVKRTAEPNDLTTASTTVQPRIRDEISVSKSALDIVRQGMVADVEDAEGSGKDARVPGFRVCGKTGTAEVWKGNRKDHYDVWFASYAPYEDPRYAVVVMVEYGKSGGVSCAPIAGRIYRALHAREQSAPAPRKDSFVTN